MNGKANTRDTARLYDDQPSIAQDTAHSALGRRMARLQASIRDTQDDIIVRHADVAQRAQDLVREKLELRNLITYDDTTDHALHDARQRVNDRRMARADMPNVSRRTLIETAESRAYVRALALLHMAQASHYSADIAMAIERITAEQVYRTTQAAQAQAFINCQRNDDIADEY